MQQASTFTGDDRDAERSALIRQAFRLEYLTLGWMLIEAGIAIGAGIAAGSLMLLAFGIDSIIELASASVLVWRLTVELRYGQVFAEKTEHMAARITGALLLALAAYIVAAAVWKLGTQTGGEFSLPGLVVSVVAIPAMYFLARRKLALAEQLGSRAMRADAVESITCGWLSFAVVFALVIQLLTGAWWVDPIASLAIVYFIVREGREAWTGDHCCGDH